MVASVLVKPSLDEAAQVARECIDHHKGMLIAGNCGISIQELIRAMIIPDWLK